MTTTGTRCASCDTEVPAGARFCPACGSPLERPSDERRVVTVLFGDVVGFTPLSESRDPEQVKMLLDRAFERLARDVTSHGGRVDKIVGDEIMAVFGAPTAHEDDPERAVRAALQMQRTLADHARETGGEVQMRIGINSGEVLVGALRGGGEITALGDVVNIASRLQSTCEPGQVLVGAATHAATREVVSYEDLGALEVKGRDAAVQAYRAVEALGPPGFRPGRVRTPLVGRKAELGMLWHALGTAVEHRRPHLLLLVGEAGVGKTRLLEEAVEIAEAQHGALVISGRCVPYGEANPWWPIAEALREAVGIEPSDPADVATEKCQRSIAGLVGTSDEGAEAQRVTDGLLYLMGYETSMADVDATRAKDEAVRAIRVSLAANAEQRPLVIVLSELHWADEVVLELIDTMFERLRELPIVLLATARPELETRWTPKPGRHNLHIVNLDPLGRDASADLVRTLLGDDASGDLVDELVERSGGNPLFLEELAVLLGETGDDARSSGELPATLRGLVSARLDALDRPERSTLEDAAVVGRTGPLPALIELAENRGEVEAEQRVDTLVQKDLLDVREETFEFKSDLVRDVAYETLTKLDRARRHAAIAKWLGRHATETDREEENVERIAHHFAVAAQLVEEVGTVEEIPEDIKRRALDWLEKAVLRAEAREMLSGSAHLIDHALKLIGPDEPARRARLLLHRARANTLKREMPVAYADIDEAERLATASGDRALEARVLMARGYAQQRVNEYEASAQTLEAAVGVWREVGDVQGEADALREWGMTNTLAGKLDAAEDAIARALETFTQAGDRKGVAWALQNLAWVAFSRGEFDLAEERLQESAATFREIGDHGGHGWSVGLLAYVWFFKGRLDEAAQVAERSIEWSRELGDRWAHGMMLNLASSIRLWQGRTSDALARSTEAHELFQEIDDKMGLINSGSTLAWALLFSGRVAEACALGERYLPMSREIYTSRLGAATVVSTIWSMAGRGDRALEILDDVQDDDSMAAARGLALMLVGRDDDAYRESVRGYEAETDPGPKANAACLLSLVAAVGGRGEEAVKVGEEVATLGGSYVDDIRAHIGRALGYAALGKSATAAEAVEAARTRAASSEDVVHQALVDLLSASIMDDAGRGVRTPIEGVRSRLSGMGVDPQPWEAAFRRAVSARTT